MKAFISNSHADEAYVERLHKHLAILKNQEVLQTWYDREILAGDPFDSVIEAELQSSDIFIAIASPDFLASDYCRDVELSKALELHNSGQLRIVSIIAEPCEWKHSPLADYKVTPQDGIPVSEWTNQNSAFLDVATEIRKLLESQPLPQHTSTEPETSKKPQLRMKRTFDDAEKALFLNETYRTFSSYFENSIAEISRIDGITATFDRVSPTAFTCSVINQNFDRGVSHITVHKKTGRLSLGDISYVFEENASADSSNGSFHVEHDEYKQFLNEGLAVLRDTKSELSQEDAALLLWELFLEEAGIKYD